jgi:hypothetical protein
MAAHEFVVDKAWQVLSDTPLAQKSTLYARVFPTRADFETVSAAASLSYAPTLLEVLQPGSTPPMRKSLMQFPAHSTVAPNYKWGVYQLILTKPGCKDRVYVGVGTQTTLGVGHRLYAYDIGYATPTLVAAAQAEGFEITHKSLLCWAPIPPPAKIPLFRLLFLALESTFTYLFWAVDGVQFGRGLTHVCPWDIHTLPYDGLCSHSALREGLRGDLDLTAEQHEASAMEQALKFRQLKAVNATNYHYKQMAENYDEYIEDAKERTYKSRLLNPGQATENSFLLRERNKEEKRYYCDPCDHAAGDQHALDNHLKSLAHDRAVNELETAEFKCWPCRRPFSLISNFRRHMRSTYHEDKMRQLNELNAPTPGPSAAQPDHVQPNGVSSAAKPISQSVGLVAAPLEAPQANVQTFAPAAPTTAVVPLEFEGVQPAVTPPVALTARQLGKQPALPEARRQSAVAPSSAAGPSTALQATRSRSPTDSDHVQAAVPSSAAPATRANALSFTPVAPSVPQASKQPVAVQPVAQPAATQVAGPAPRTVAPVRTTQTNNPFRCELCNANPKTVSAHNIHINTPRHKRLTAASDKRKRLHAEAMARHQVWLDERAAVARQLK